MSMYGDDEHGNQKNMMYDEMMDFLEENPVSLLLKIVADVVRDKNGDDYE